MITDLSILFNILDHLTKIISERTIQTADKKVNDIYDLVENKMNTVIKENIIDKKEYIYKNDIMKIRKFILESCGGVENIAFIKKYKSGYQFVFFDFNKVKYFHMKNFNCRVFISEERSSMILIPYDKDMLKYLLSVD